MPETRLLVIGMPSYAIHLGHTARTVLSEASPPEFMEVTIGREASAACWVTHWMLEILPIIDNIRMGGVHVGV